MADTALFSTYNQVGKAEDVSDVISNIDPFDTPFQSMIGTEKCSAINPSWQEDSLGTPAGKLAPVEEGHVYSASARTPTSLRSNYTEIRADSFEVSETSDAIRTYGRAKETAYQMMKVGKEQKNFWEVKLLAHDEAAADAVVGINAAAGTEEGDTADARTAGNVWGTDIGSSAILANRSAATTSQVAFDEDAFLVGMQKTYTEGAPGKVLMVTPGVTQMIKDWATLPAGRFRDGGQDKKVTMVVDFLVTPYGEVKVVLNRWLAYDVDGTIKANDNANAALLIDPSYWKILVLRGWASGPLAKTSDSSKYYIRAEMTLKHRNYSEGYGWVNLDAPAAP
jgi:hypothetical protein